MVDVVTALYNEGLTSEYDLDVKRASYTQAQIAAAELYTKERYDRARTILDLMMEKLPVAVAPLGVAIGPSVADLYIRLGEVTGNESDFAKARALLENEINLYKQYVLFIQTLTRSQFVMLPRSDRYIYDTMFMQLLQLYANAEGDTETMLKDLQSQGVDFGRFYRDNKVSASADSVAADTTK
jgi:hypothetical protein